jgi:hypothetical protein
MTWETTRAETISSERDSFPLLLFRSLGRSSLSTTFCLSKVQRHALPVTMRFRSTLVITFLVSILDILASVGAATSGIQSRSDDGSFPIVIDFVCPSYHEMTTVDLGGSLLLA